jgi:DNA primase
MALSEDFLYQLRNANSIETIMSSYTNLKRRGHNYVCLCPFHSEKTPSCTIYVDTQSFYCFGCGAGGDVITFIMKSENLSYIEAVKYLAERANIALPDEELDDKSGKIKQRVYEINRTAAKFFYSQLKSPAGRVGLQYLLERGLTPETIKKYGLGFAEDKWTTLTNYMLSEGFTEDELVISGLCGRSKSGRVFDVFRNRVIFPIIDLRGNVIAFGGRLLSGEGPKYLNSSDTPVFKKSRNLFSLNFAKTSNEKRLILAEGYMDVIAINQAGFSNVVATLGTALTPEQARLMSQYAEEIIIAYDSDEAGQKATYKAINLLSEVGLKTKILKTNDAKDPDEFIKKFGSTRFKLLLDNSEGAIVFEINKCKNGLDMDSDVGRVEYLRRVTKVLSEIVSPVEREVYISRVANEQGISKDTLLFEVNAIIKKRQKSQDKKEWRNITNQFFSKRDNINPEASKYPREAKAEAGIIAFLLLHPDKFDVITEKISPENFVTSFNKKVYESLILHLQSSYEVSISTFNGEFSPDEMGKISEILAKSREIEINEQTVLDYIDVLLSHIDNKDKNEDMSDEDFLEFFNNLKDKNR